jgi:peroxiredoxin
MPRFCLVFVLACTCIFGQNAAPPAPKVPRQAPNFAIQTGPGKFTWLSEYNGKTRILAFILTTCPHCQFTTGILNKLQTEYASKGVQILATAIEPMSALHLPDFEKKFQPKFLLGYNDQGYVAKFLGLPENDPMFVPHLVFIDKTGVIREEFEGEDQRLMEDVQEKNLREALEKTLNAK